MKKRQNYIVYAPPYCENSGGNIFLHLLVHTLNSLGENAFIWPWDIPPRRTVRRTVNKIVRKPKTILHIDRVGFDIDLNPDFISPQANYSDLRKDSIVVYPEVTLGNPLNARNVVRWLLYKPGVIQPYEFTEGEMFFRASEMCDLPDVTGNSQDLYLWHRLKVYRNENRPNRSGACFAIRKGNRKPRIPETEKAICIDGLPHIEIAEIFNRCEVFYSYDETTFYSQYAALCGCLSIIVPGQYKSRREWVAEHPLGRYGVAYGLDDTAHALETRDKVEDMLNMKVEEGVRTVRAFIKATQDAFS